MAARTRPLLMGVVNVTPDSFSDGGRWLDTDRAVAHGLELAAQGAELVDVGGESTRPGAGRPDPDEELARVIPVITRLVAAGVAVSVDTMRGSVAREAVAAGATVVNDVSGGLADPELVTVVADTGVTMVAQHWRAHGAVMQGADHLAYADVVADVRRELAGRLAALVDAGVREEQVVLDPGIGFSKTAEHNWRLLAHLDELASLGRPLLVGTSRKRFLGALLAAPDGAPRPADERDVATAATTLLAAQTGVWGLRVHDVRASADALAVLDAWQDAR